MCGGAGQMNTISMRSPVATTSKLIYRLLNHACQNNRQNQFHAAQWLDLFVQHVRAAAAA
jgi:hypothetical protein